jgi:group I intron endonuclease
VENIQLHTRLDLGNFDMDCAIYTIKNLDNAKMYVGSSKEIERRKTNHWYQLSHGKHINPHLQNAWNKHGEHAFVFSILEVIDDPSYLSEREQWWLDHLTPFDEYGYNIRKDASDGRRGTINPEEVRRKISATLTGRERSKEHCQNIAKARTGVSRKGMKGGWKHSEETKARMGEARKGKYFGSSNNKAKFTEEDVVKIRERLALGESGLSIANDYGVTRRAIYQIRDKITWKHVKEK